MTIKLAEQERERLRKLGDAKKRSVHWLAKEAIIRYLENEETAERFRQETRDRWEEFSRTQTSISNDSVMEWLETWGSDDEGKPPA